MAVYAYIYSNFPSKKERKYYVCDYGRGRAHTYQVVPQLQREFDRKAYENKTRINKKRFRKLRKKGALFTSKNAQKRAPLYGELAGELPECWERLGAWLGGQQWPGEVDWQELGAELRANLEAGRRLPEALRPLAEQVETGRGESWDVLWDRLSERQREAAWFHFWRTEPGESGDGVEDLSGSRRLYEAVRERSAEVDRVDEMEWVARLAEPLVDGGATEWSVLMEALPAPEAWYETIETADGSMRVPSEALYDLHWRVADSLEGLGLNHACATQMHESAGRGLHARFHAGARRAVVVTVEAFPTCVTADAIWRELSFATNGGQFRGWSDEGLDTLTTLLVDPETERLSGGSPAADVVAEFAAWPVDEAIRRRLDEELDSGERWRYSRHGGQIVVSTPEASSTEEINTARALVAEALEAQEWRLEVSTKQTWQAGDQPLVLGGLEVPAEFGEPVELTGADARRAERALEAVLAGEGGAAERATLESAYALTGRLDYGLAADEEWRRDVERLAESLSLEAFAPRCINGLSLR